MEDAILNENYGIMNSMGAWLESVKQNNSADLIRDLPEIGRIQALKEVAGPTVVDLLLAASPNTVHALTKRLLDSATVAASSGQGTVADAMAAGEAQNQGEDYYNGLITRWQNTIQEASKGTLPTEIVQSNVQYMFGVDSQAIFAQMSDNDKYEYYRQVVSPIVTQQMLQIRDTGDEQSWNTYQAWATNAFVGLFRQSVQDIQQINTSSRFSGVNVRWDPKVNGFMIQSPGILGIGTFDGPTKNLNTAIQTIAPIIEANGEDVSENLLELMEGMGWDPTVVRETGMLEGLAKALFNALPAESALKSMISGDNTAQQAAVDRRYGK